MCECKCSSWAEKGKGGGRNPTSLSFLIQIFASQPLSGAAVSVPHSAPQLTEGREIHKTLSRKKTKKLHLCNVFERSSVTLLPR